jgi:ubiquinone/menaquinone biosynthesis C-methylase UbiE
MTSSPTTGGGVIIDLGTGDGSFVYQSARRHPDQFYIGIDAESSALEKVSEKIHRKPEKGGAANILFIQAAVEDLPSELDGVAVVEYGSLPPSEWPQLQTSWAKRLRGAAPRRADLVS